MVSCPEKIVLKNIIRLGYTLYRFQKIGKRKLEKGILLWLDRACKVNLNPASINGI